MTTSNTRPERTGGPGGPRRAISLDGVTYAPGERFRVIAEGAVLDGLVPARGSYKSWRQQLRPGDILTCTGYGPGFGGDPGYGVEFTSAGSEAAGAFHCQVRPVAGGALDYRPARGLLQPDEAAAGPGARSAQHDEHALRLYDLRCSAESLRAAAAWVATRKGPADVTLAIEGGQLACRHGGSSSMAFAAGEPAGYSRQVLITREALAAAAAWAAPGDDMADVTLLIDDRMLLVGQGDDFTGLDTGGEPASAEYLETAPLD